MGTLALEVAFTESEHLVVLITLGFAGVLILFAMWWIYFAQRGCRSLPVPLTALVTVAQTRLLVVTRRAAPSASD